jgi:hypothetical protein
MVVTSRHARAAAAGSVLCGLAAVGLLGAFGASSAACSRDPRFVDRGVFIYSPQACPVSKSEAFAVIYGSGDFDPSDQKPAVASLFLRDDGAVFSDLPPATRALLVDVSHLSNGSAWRGVGAVPNSGPVDVLVWPNDEVCSLTRSVESRNDPTERDTTLAVLGRTFMVTGGLQAPGAAVPHTYVGDLSTGMLEAAENSTLEPRAFATVTPFAAPGEGGDAMPALVAGGQDPEKENPSDPLDIPTKEPFEVADTAEVYRPDPSAPGSIGRFHREDPLDTIRLSVPRTQHGAVVLSDGRTLLVGGRGVGGGVLDQIEAIDPVDRESHREGFISLAHARARPDVIRLANGEVLVYGGVGIDGRTLGSFEWLDRQGIRLPRQTPDLVPGLEHGIVPLAAGGALVVIKPVDPNGAFPTVWVVSAEGTLEPAIPLDPKELLHVHLFRGAGGAPVLFTGKPRGWWRWDPWFGVFQRILDAPIDGPRSDVIANGDDGLALWFEERGGTAGMYVQGYRFDAKTEYAELPPMLAGEPSPAYLAPDRLANRPGSSITYDPAVGLLVGPGASAFLTDVTYADFTVDVDVVQAAPEIVLRQESGVELAVGGAECAFGQNAQKTLHVERRRGTVTVRADDQDARECGTKLPDGARVSVGVRGASGVNVSGAKNLRVRRR